MVMILTPYTLCGCSRFLYPARESPASSRPEEMQGTRPLADGKYEHFAKVNDAVQVKIRELLAESKHPRFN